jgi:hypothetical protein
MREQSFTTRRERLDERTTFSTKISHNVELKIEICMQCSETIVQLAEFSV